MNTKPEKPLEQKYDGVARTIGKAGIWFSIIFNTLLAIISIVVVVYISAFYRKGWTSKEATVNSISCHLITTRFCKEGNGRRSCPYRRSQNCFLDIEGFGRISHEYKNYDLPPTAGGLVKVYYNPDKPERDTEFSLSAGYHKTLVPILLGVIALLCATVTYLLFKYRHSKKLQRLGFFFFLF